MQIQLNDIDNHQSDIDNLNQRIEEIMKNRTQRYLYKELQLDQVQLRTLKIQIQKPPALEDDPKPTVRSLQLSNNNISYYSDNWIPALQELHLDNNNLIEFTGNYFPTAGSFSFPNNPNLSLFDNNTLDAVGQIAIGPNKLASFSNNFLRSLTSLSIEESPLESMRFVGNRVPLLRVLNLTGNNISDFSGNTLSGLEELYLRNGSIQQIDASIVSTVLRIAHLEHNELSTFSGFNIPLLWYLNIANNRLTDFSNNQFTSLQELYLQHNQLTNFTFSTDRLQRLDLSDNLLSSFNNSNRLVNLTWLNLSQNALTSF